MTSLARRRRERKFLLSFAAFVSLTLTAGAILALLPTAAIGFAVSTAYLAFCAATSKP
jgi:hypothetical protein